MAAGLPAVGITSPGIEDLIMHERNGLLAEDDLAAFTAMLTRMAGDAELRRSLALGAIETANGFGIDATVARLLSYYKPLVHAGRRKRGPSRRKSRPRVRT
jgi:glycosyltransferase involved in cell wall biosynthesis